MHLGSSAEERQANRVLAGWPTLRRTNRENHQFRAHVLIPRPSCVEEISNHSQSSDPGSFSPSFNPSICTLASASLSPSSFISFSFRFLFIFSMILSARLKIPPVGVPHARHLGVFAYRLMAHAEQ